MSKLVKLGHKNASTLRAFAGVCRNLESQNVNLRSADVWLPLFSYSGLFDPLDDRIDSEVERERKRLKSIYQQVDRVTSQHKPEFDPLTAPKAVRVQKSAMKQAFHQLLGVELDSHHLATLGLYGSVGIAIRDFLRHCGYGLDLRIYVPVEQQLPSFVIRAGLRHSRLSARKGILHALGEKVDWTNKLAALWLRAEKTIRRTHWKQQDRRETKTWLAQRIKAYDGMQTMMMKRIIDTDPTAQAFVLRSLAFQMYLSAMAAVANLAMGISEAGSLADESLEHEAAFDKALESLKRNVEALLAL